MNEIQIFQNSQFGNLRTVMKDGNPWFVAADVCKALELNRTATRRLDNDEKGVHSTHTPGGTQDLTVVSESGLYSLVLGSRKPEARLFKRWITHDVIPAIRANGAYLTPDVAEQVLSDPDTLIRLATSLKQERAARIDAEQEAALAQLQIAADADKVAFAEAVSQSSGDITIGQMAILLCQNGLHIGRNTLFSRLRQDGLIQQNSRLPTQRAMRLHLFRVVEYVTKNPGGTTSLHYVTHVTPHGQQYLMKRYLAPKQLPAPGFLADLID